MAMVVKLKAIVLNTYGAVNRRSFACSVQVLTQFSKISFGLRGAENMVGTNLSTSYILE